MNTQNKSSSTYCVDILKSDEQSSGGINSLSAPNPRKVTEAFVYPKTNMASQRAMVDDEHLPPAALSSALGFAHRWKDTWNNDVNGGARFSHCNLNSGEDRRDATKAPQWLLSLSGPRVNYEFENEKERDGSADQERKGKNQIHKKFMDVCKRGCCSTVENQDLKKRPSNSKENENVEKKSDRSVSNILSTFAERTSLPAAIFVSTANGPLKRSLWIFVLLAMFLGLTFNLVFLVRSYISYPKFTEISLGFRPLEFPAVTICNVNPARSSRLSLASDELQALVRDIKPIEIVQRMVTARRVLHVAETLIKNTGDGLSKGVNDFIKDVEDLGAMLIRSVGDHGTSIAANSSDFNATTFQTSDIEFDKLSLNETRAPLYYSRLTSVSIDSPPTTTTTTRVTELSGATASEIGNFQRNGDESLINSVELDEDEDREREVNGEPSHTARRRRSFFERLGKVLGAESDNEPSSGSEVGSQETSNESDSTGSEVTEINKLPDAGDTGREGQNSSLHDSLNNISSSDDPRAVLNISSTPNDPDEILNQPHASTKAPNVPLNAASTDDPFVALNVPSANDSLVQTREDQNSSNSTQSKSNSSDFISFFDNVDLTFKNSGRQVREDVLGRDAPFPDVSVTTAIVDEFRYLFSRENRSTRMEMGHQIEDMLVDCSFDGNRCYPSNFAMQTSTSFGNCYTIDEPGMIVRKSGTSFGLSLILFLEQKEFLTGLTPASGGHLTIHPRKSIPFPETAGIAVPASMEVDVALKLIHIKRLGKPYGECDEGDSDTLGVTYTLQTCQHFCQQKIIVLECGCHSSYAEDDRVFEAFNNLSLHPCYTEEELHCFYEAREKYLNKELVCDCKNPCSENVYSKRMSMRQWPSSEYALILTEGICERMTESDCLAYKEMTSDEFSANFIKLNIYFEDLNYENVTEKPSYESTQFFSDIGGTVGLWLGLSAMTLFEFGHLIICLVQVTISNICRRL